MSSYNKCTFLGNVTAAPETRTTTGGTVILHGSLAINRTYKDKEGRKVKDVDFIPFSAFGNAAELIQKYVKKGDSILLAGAMRQEKWETNAGEKRSRLCLRVEDFTFLNNNRES